VVALERGNNHMDGSYALDIYFHLA
jgi:hypothetical protein